MSAPGGNVWWKTPASRDRSQFNDGRVRCVDESRNQPGRDIRTGINIVDERGVVRMVISSKERFPNPIVNGREVVTNRRPSAGIIFYNDDGDECGGLVFGNGEAAILFDRYKQDQVIGLTYTEGDRGPRYGLTVWDRSERPIAELIERLEVIRSMHDGPEKVQAQRDLEAELRGSVRLFVGREPGGGAVIVVADSMGRERVRIGVGSDGEPRIELLDENGGAVYSLPPKKRGGGRGSPNSGPRGAVRVEDPDVGGG